MYIFFSIVNFSPEIYISTCVIHVCGITNGASFDAGFISRVDLYEYMPNVPYILYIYVDSDERPQLLVDLVLLIFIRRPHFNK